MTKIQIMCDNLDEWKKLLYEQIPEISDEQLQRKMNPWSGGSEKGITYWRNKEAENDCGVCFYRIDNRDYPTDTLMIDCDITMINGKNYLIVKNIEYSMKIPMPLVFFWIILVSLFSIISKNLFLMVSSIIILGVVIYVQKKFLKQRAMNDIIKVIMHMEDCL